MRTLIIIAGLLALCPLMAYLPNNGFKNSLLATGRMEDAKVNRELKGMPAIFLHRSGKQAIVLNISAYSPKQRSEKNGPLPFGPGACARRKGAEFSRH
jgi:hypothetical protein